MHRILKPGGLLALAMEGSTESPNQQKLIALAAPMESPIYSGAEMVEMLTVAGFSRAWFESVPDKASGWLCALGAKQPILVWLEDKTDGNADHTQITASTRLADHTAQAQASGRKHR